ncbi:unnamed protein product [Lupinus luteus]|uniref:Secreted protein n=1 Tax=Lupinus luteus TaxID=3873 RepID=A0AAV1W8R9_LUPLU
MIDGLITLLLSSSPLVVAFTVWHEGPLSTVINLISSIFCSRSLNSGHSSRVWSTAPCSSQLYGLSSSTSLSAIPCLHISWKITFMGVFISVASQMKSLLCISSTAFTP